MIISDQLRISDDGKQILIDAHVSKAECFSGVTIQSLYICLGSQVYETLTIDPESNGNIYHKTYDDVLEIHECINISDENLAYNKTSFSKDLFFVYVGCNTVPEGCECYAHVGRYVLGVTFDENLLYQRVMGYTKQLADDCKLPVEFTDFILLWNAFKASVETEHYIPAIKYYNMLFGMDAEGHSYGAYDKNSGIISKPCGCHG